MKRLSCYIIILIFFTHSHIIAGIASEISLGGELNSSLTAFNTEEAGFSLLPEASLDLELFVPSWKDNEIKCAVHFFTDVTEGQAGYFWKKLYWKHKFKKLHLTIGKQPISWSFGSLLNPVDFELGAAALEQEYNLKFQNALEIYYPLNWNTNISLVVSRPGNTRDWKAGLRGRTLIKDFDITVHYILEQISPGEVDDYRLGITAKGDAGPFGVYSSIGYYSTEKANSFLAGLDYSFFFPAGNQLYLQVEYLNIPRAVLPSITGSEIFVSEEEPENNNSDNITLLAGNATYKIDEFSSTGISVLYSYSNGQILFLPSYSNKLNTNDSVQIQGGIMTKLVDKHGGSSSKVIFKKPDYLFLKIGLSHTF